MKKSAYPFLLSIFCLLQALCFTSASLAAGTGKIVYYTNVPDNGSSVHYQVYLINPDGTGNTRLNRASDDLLPVLSPDGSKIAFSSSLGAGVWLMNPDGTGAAKIPNSDPLVHPDWSPDGQSIVGSANGAIAIIRIDGTGYHAITPQNDPVATYPAWSPDGTKISFQGYTFASRSQKIYVVNADGSSAPVILAESQTNEYFTPAWSPDGSKITASKNGNVVILDAVTGAETLVTPSANAFGDGSPTFSPDGTEIAYQDSGGSSGLAVMNSDGTNRRAFNTPRANSPKWSRAAAPSITAVLNPDNGHYYQYVPFSGTWSQAKSAALSQVFMGAAGHLATVTSAGENSFIQMQFGASFSSSFSTSPTWLGAFQTPGSAEPAGGYTWITGESFSFTNWGGGEPNDNRVVGDENVIEIRSDGLWNDTAETRTGQGYVVEFEQASPTPTPPPHGGLSATTFSVNELSTSSVNVADTVLRFRAGQSGRPAGLKVRVQSSTDQVTWTDLPDGAQGRMTYEMQVSGFVLNSTSYPLTNGVYFRAYATAPGYGDSVSNEVGPFNLASSQAHLSAPLLFVTTNGEINAIRFGVKQTDIPSGIAVRVQTSQNPADEASWSDAPIGTAGHLTQDTTTPDLHQFYLGTNDYPSSEGVYFRAIASAPGNVDGLSFAYGPFKFVSDPASVVTITVNGVGFADGNAPDDALLLSSGTFNMQVNASSGRFIRRVTVIYDGITIGHFDNGATSGSLDYTSNIAGDHLVEAYATDDLGVTGAAPPVHVRILPAAPGKLYQMTQSGAWNTAANWITINGEQGVPGTNDFAVVGAFNPTLSTPVTVNAVSLNGGTISGAKLTVTAFCTIAAGNIKSDLTIPSGSTGLLTNDADIGLSGTLNYAGVLRMHGKGGITGVKTGAATAGLNLAADPNGFFDGILGVIKGVGKFFADLAGGGRKGSRSAPAPAANPPPKPEIRMVRAQAINISAGQVVAVPAPLISQDGGGLITQDGGGLISQDGGGLVASGGGNLVASGGGNLVASGGGNLLSQDGGGLVASGGGNLVATGGGNLVASGGGNLVASGGGNAPASRDDAGAASAPTVAGFNQSGGEVNLSGFTITGDVQVDGGILSGSGLILGNLTNSAGVISPGHSAGGIGVSGDFAQGPNGTLIIENGGASFDLYDTLNVVGTASLGGKLDVKLINGYNPDPADTFNPLGYASATGSFASISANAQVTSNESGLLVTTNPAIAGPSFGQPVNISTRLRVLTGDNVLIGGFIVTGPAGSTKAVLIRGKGPSLSGAGLSGVLSDPLLELHKPGGGIITNDNWMDAPNKDRIPNGFAPTDPRESIIIADLAPGNYTVIEKGAKGESGIGLAEIYDIDGDRTVKLSNISTRGFVDTGDNAMIGGFIVGGSEPASILVRAAGPSLGRAPSNLSGVLADPILELHDSNGNVLTNDDWRETQEAEILATTVAPVDDKEPAILANLVPGSYTAIVRGKDGTTGIAIVEAYRVK